MKHLIKIALLTLPLCLILASCKSEQDAPVQTLNSTTPLSEATEATTSPAPPLTVFENGKSEYRIVRSGKVDGIEQNLFLQFYLQMDQRSGVKFSYVEDTIAFNKTPDPTTREILLGSTNRAESIALKEKLQALGGSRFGITVGEYKIAITGTDSYQTFLGLDYLMENFIQSDENGLPAMRLENGFEYISEENNEDADSNPTANAHTSPATAVMIVMNVVLRISHS